MTPLYQHLAGASLAGRVTVQPELAAMGCTAGDFLRMVAETAAIYRIDEAEFDTTDARLKDPEHFATFAHFRLPAPVCWLENRIYGKDGRLQAGRAAFVATTQPSGAIRVFNVGDNGTRDAYLAHCFDLPASMVGNRRLKLGHPIHLQTSSPLAGRGAEAVANFFFELVEFLHFPGLVVEETPSGLKSGLPIKTVSLDRTPRDDADALVFARPGRVQ